MTKTVHPSATSGHRPGSPEWPQGSPFQNFLSINDLDKAALERLIERTNKHHADLVSGICPDPIAAGHALMTLFFENSTRTMVSFARAGGRLGMDVIDVPISRSSVAKGEDLLDTVQTLDAMHPSTMVIRHSGNGVPATLAASTRAGIINAGDGNNEHPTQALLDAATIHRHKGGLKGLTVTIMGDIAHSRVANSNTLLLIKMGASVRWLGPDFFLPTAPEGVEVTSDMQTGLMDADVVMVLRNQKERMDEAAIPTDETYFEDWGLTHERLCHAKPDTIVMHPGPMNRGVEISPTLADDAERAVILEQVETGVAARMAVLEYVLGFKA